MWDGTISHFPSGRSPHAAGALPVLASGMNSTVHPAPVRARPSTAAKPKAAQARSAQKSASKRADEIAKRGEPLSANKPNERSPKQENL